MSNEGEIKGLLKLEDAGFFRTIEAAKAEVRELTSMDPRVRVQADTAAARADLAQIDRAAEKVDRTETVKVRAEIGTARTQLDAVGRSAEKVALAEGRLKSATQASDRATAVALLAQMRLAEVQGKRGRTALQVATAEEALRFAIEKSESAAVKAVFAEDKLASAHREAAAAALAHGAAEETVEGAIDRVSRRADSGAGRVALWTSAIVAALPPLIPIAGVAVGGAVALGALGAAGILAGTGIARGAKTGQGAYAVYRPLIQEVLDDVYKLQDTAAVGLLPGAEKSLAVLERKMPVITRGVNEFAGRLGQIAPTGLSAVITLVERGAPLWRSGADWIGRMVQGLDDFGHSDAYKGFIDYSVRNGPKVERFLARVVDLAGDILVAWAPMGEAALPVLTELVSGAGDLVHALGPVTPAIAGVYLAFRAWSGIRVVIDGVRTGLMLLGVQATVTGGQVATAGTAARGAGLLAASGWVAAGVALSQYAQATAAQANYDNAKKLTPGTPERKSEVAAMASRASMKAPQSTGGGGMDAGLGAQINASLKSTAAAKSLSAAQSAAADATRYAAQAAKENAARQAVQAQRMQAAVVAANNLAAKQALAAGTAQSLEGAQLGARSAISGMAAAAKQNGTSLAFSTEKGLQNRQAILGAVQGISAYGAAVQKSTGSAAAGQSAMDGMTVSLVKSATAAGFSKSEVSGLVAKLLGIPKEAVTRLVAIDEATPKALKAAASARNFSVDKYRAVLEANGVPADVALRKAQAAAAKWAKSHPKATIDGEASPAVAAAKRAQSAAKQYMAGNYKAALKADPTLANSNIAAARKNAVQFGGLRPQARLRADASQAISAARAAAAAIAAVRSKSVTISAVYKATGSAQAAKNYAKLGGSATGGTVGSSSIGTMRALQGMAVGGTARTGLWTRGDGYTVRGAGSAATDTAGVFRLALGEEVTSNLFGQADRNRPMLKAINSGDNARIRRTAQEQYGAGPRGPQQVINRTIAPHITVVNPVAVDPVDQVREGAQLLLAYADI